MILRTPVTPRTATSYTVDPEMSRLATLFQPVYDQAASQVDAARGEALRRLRANQAARGILRSGVSDYGSGEVERGAILGTGEAAAKLAGLLGQTESSRSLMNTQSRLAEEAAAREHARNLELVRAAAKRKSKLGSLLGNIGQGVQLAGGIAGLMSGNPMAAAPVAGSLSSMFSKRQPDDDYAF